MPGTSANHAKPDKRERGRIRYAINLLVDAQVDQTLIPELIANRSRITRSAAKELLDEQLNARQMLREKKAAQLNVTPRPDHEKDGAGGVMTAEEKKQVQKLVGSMCLFDDYFFQVVLKDNKRAAEELLRPILKDPDLSVAEVNVQERLPGMPGERAAVIDLRAVTGNGEIVAVEIQRSKEGAAPERARFLRAKEDTGQLRSGQSYRELHDVYVIVMMEGDPYGDGEPMYHVKTTIEENGKEYCDGSYIIYTNGMYSGSDPMGRLMHDMRATDPNEMYNNALRETVGRYKKTAQEGEYGVSYQTTAELDELIGNVLRRAYGDEFEKMDAQIRRAKLENEAKDKEIAELKANKDRELGEKDRELGEKDRELGEKDRELEDMRKELADLRSLLAAQQH